MLNSGECLSDIFNISNKEIFTGDRCHIRNQFKIGFGCDIDYTSCYDYDVFAFLLGENGKVISFDHVLFYNSELRVLPHDLTQIHHVKNLSANLVSAPVDPELSVIGHFEDNTGAVPFEHKPDDEVWQIDLNRIHPEVVRIIFCISINGGLNSHQYFGDARLFVRFLYPEQNGLETEYLYEPKGDYRPYRAIEVCSIDKVADSWEIVPLGVGHENIKELIERYVG